MHTKLNMSKEEKSQSGLITQYPSKDKTQSPVNKQNNKKSSSQLSPPEREQLQKK